MIKIYVAGPYTQGDKEFNAKSMIDTGAFIHTLGFIPYVPLLTHWWDLEHPMEYEKWMSYHNEWLYACDGLYRMPGISPGSDREVRHMFRQRKPVFYTIDELLSYVWE